MALIIAGCLVGLVLLVVTRRFRRTSTDPAVPYNGPLPWSGPTGRLDRRPALSWSSVAATVPAPRLRAPAPAERAGCDRDACTCRDAEL